MRNQREELALREASDEEVLQLYLRYQRECQVRALIAKATGNKAHNDDGDYLLPGRTPAESTMYYTSCYGFLLWDPTIRIVALLFPSLKPLLLSATQACYCLFWANLAREYVHPHADVFVMPLITYVAGMYHFGLTRHQTLNTTVSVVLMFALAPLLALTPYGFAQLGFITIMRNIRIIPSLYDFHPCSLISALIFCLGVWYGLIGAQATFEHDPISLFVTTSLISNALGIRHEHADTSLQRWIRTTAARICKVSITTLAKSALYFAFGARAYYAYRTYLLQQEATTNTVSIS